MEASLLKKRLGCPKGAATRCSARVQQAC